MANNVTLYFILVMCNTKNTYSSVFYQVDFVGRGECGEMGDANLKIHSLSKCKNRLRCKLIKKSMLDSWSEEKTHNKEQLEGITDKFSPQVSHVPAVPFPLTIL